MMSTIASVLGGLAVGAAVGSLFFAGLWATVRRLPDVRRPAVLATGSLLLRMAFAAAAFIVIAQAGWVALLAALLAFLAVRSATIARWGPQRTPASAHGGPRGALTTARPGPPRTGSAPAPSGGERRHFRPKRSGGSHAADS